MCIALFSTAHPDYSLIVASNRDEYLRRPTARATWWTPPHAHVLAGRDLFAPARGTWLGVTRDGRIAVLTNFREDTPQQPPPPPPPTPSSSSPASHQQPALVSRGAMVNAYLTQPPPPSATAATATATAGNSAVEDTESFARRLISGEAARGSGGFTLVCGRLGQPLAVVSNRMTDEGEVAWIGGGGGGDGGDGGDHAAGEDGKGGTTIGLSNAAFGDRSWPKVTMGEELVGRVVREHAEKYSRHTAGNGGSGGSGGGKSDAQNSGFVPNGGGGDGGDATDQEAIENELIQNLLGVLSTNTLPMRKDDEGWATYVKRLKESIFIPVVGGDDPTYYGDEIASGRSARRVSVNRLAPGSYATGKQTVVLVRREKGGQGDGGGGVEGKGERKGKGARVTFVEKTLYEDAAPVRGDPDALRVFRFDVDEGEWE